MTPDAKPVIVGDVTQVAQVHRALYEAQNLIQGPVTTAAILQALSRDCLRRAAELITGAGELEQAAKRNRAEAARLESEAAALDADIETLSSAPTPKDQEPHGRSSQGRPRRS